MSSSLSLVIESFLLTKQAEGCTKKTIQWHESSLNTFSRWIIKEKHPQNPDEWDATLLRQYIVWLQKNNDFSPSTVTTKVQSLLAFTRWLEQEGLTPTNVGARIKKPKLPHVQKPPFMDDELKRIIEWSKRSGWRDYAIICLLIDCGLRVSEVCDLEIRNIHFSQGLLTVRGKGQKDRVVPFSASTGIAMQRYLVKERDPETDVHQLFLSKKRIEPMTPNGILQMVYRIAENARVENVHPHRFRHTFAINYLRNGGDPLTLRRILGHSSMEMTAHYTNFNNNDLHKAHVDASPLTNLMKKRKT